MNSDTTLTEQRDVKSSHPDVKSSNHSIPRRHRTWISVGPEPVPTGGVPAPVSARRRRDGEASSGPERDAPSTRGRFGAKLDLTPS